MKRLTTTQPLSFSAKLIEMLRIVNRFKVEYTILRRAKKREV